jgi:hypothetical protein
MPSQAAFDPYDIAGILANIWGASTGFGGANQAAQSVIGGLATKDAQGRARSENEAALAEIRKLFDELRRRGTSTIGEGQGDVTGLVDRATGNAYGAYPGLEDEINRGYGARERDINRFLDEQGGITQQAYQDRETGILSELGARTGQVEGGYGSLISDLTGKYDERSDRILGYLDTVGSQEREDLLRRGEEQEAETIGQLQASGLGTTTLTGEARTLSRERTQDTLNRLNDLLNRERVAADTQLSGDALAAEERLRTESLSASERIAENRARTQSILSSERLSDLGRVRDLGLQTRAGLSGERLSARERGAERTLYGQRDELLRRAESRQGQYRERIGYDLDVSRAEIDFLNSVQRPYPDTNWITENSLRLGQNAAYKPPETNWYDSLAPAAAAGVGTAAGTALGSGFASYGLSGLPFLFSDREAKNLVAEVDGESVLAKLRTLPVTRWTYRADGSRQEHVGPMAQDFHAAFGLSDDRSIAVVDVIGVLISAVQALAAKVDRLSTK